jgi:hypothetical protein
LIAQGAQGGDLEPFPEVSGAFAGMFALGRSAEVEQSIVTEADPRDFESVPAIARHSLIDAEN